MSGDDERAYEEMVKGFTHWRLRYKLLFILLLLGVAASAVTGSIAYIKHLHSLEHNVLNQLTTLRRAKAFQIESYYQTIRNHVLTLSEDRMFIDAMREFREAYNRLNEVPVTAELRRAVVEDYRSQFYPQMCAPACPASVRGLSAGYTRGIPPAVWVHRAQPGSQPST
jgi:hypothetical protein